MKTKLASKYRSGKADFKKISYQDYDWGLKETK